MHDTDWAKAFIPVGDQLLASTLTRRSFIGACIGIPVAPLLLGTSTAGAAATLERGDSESSLRFTEDQDGLSVTWYPALQASAWTWRIVRKAFGPDAKFTLRRLAVQPKLIFQLKVEDARFGELKSASHWITFTHVPEERRWRVRLRTDIWCAPKHLRSNEEVGIPFEHLSICVGEESASSAIKCKVPPQESEGFCIDTDASVLGPALQSVLEQHVRVEGPLRLTLARNGVWSLIPRRAGRQALGKIQLADGALVAPHGISMAWCEPESDDGPGAVIAKDRRRTHDDPVFVAWGEIEASAKPIVLGNAAGPRVTLKALRLIASTDPSKNPASPEESTPVTSAQASAPENPTKSKRVGTGQPTQPTQECRADAKSSGLDRAEAVKAFIERHGRLGSDPPQWRYVRRDWSWKDRHPAGISTVRAAWMIHFARSPKLPELGPLCIHEGALAHSKSFEPRLKFAGRLDGNPWWLKSRIGWLRVQGWTSDASEIDPANASANTHHPLMTAESAGFGSVLSSLDVPLLLTESELAPSGCEFSKLTFAPTGLRAAYASDARNASTDLRASDSYLWLGAPSEIGDLPLAHIDLTRARIEVARTHDLARLAFVFAGLHLDILDRCAWITDTRASCGVRKRIEPGRDSDASVLDTRPVLVAEFPPQHVFEEAIFRPGAAPLPDVALRAPRFAVMVGGEEKTFSASLPELLLQLKLLKTEAERVVVREAYAELKKMEQKDEQSPAHDKTEPFDRFSKEFKKLFEQPTWKNKWPSDHQVYIGAACLPPDLAVEARRIYVEMRKEVLAPLLTRTLTDANNLVKLLNGEKPTSSYLTETWYQRVYQFASDLYEKFLQLNPADKVTHPLPPRDRAYLIERAVSGVMQGYADFRDYFAQWMVENQGNQLYDLDDLEYFSEDNRPKDLKLSLGKYQGWVAESSKAYLKLLGGTQEPAPLMRARLSGPSRLAFHVDCGSRPGIDLEDGDAHFPSKKWPGQRNLPAVGTWLPFSFDALTDWGHYDLAVTPRARQAAAFDDVGVLIRRDISEGGLDDDSAGADIAMIKSLGIRSGQVTTRPQGPGRSRDWGKELRTVQERLADVEASLRVVPDELQTAIELPARLILSPSQKAQWRTPRQWCPDSGRPVPLWSATLTTDSVNPLVRAVASPDMRPEFVRYGLERRLLAVKTGSGDPAKSPHSPVGSAPPRGPRAPWTLGFEESDPNVTIEELFLATSPDGTPKPMTAADICAKQDQHQVIEYLCRRMRDRAAYGKHALFRSTLDAYDRHEIVLLSSAWGLPVRGRREKSGELQAVRVSSQVELPPEWRLLDAQAGTAMYRPRALKVRELTLTALGGTLRHDSDFVPPAAARHIIHGPLFDSMAVERWQHWTVLGRDAFSEVVYKGYLFPIGHRASLVKQTERMFLRPAGGGLVRAYLRQRMFIRLARPDKTFPAYGQPHGGRKFPGGVVSMLTLTTPDIVDPTEDTQKLDKPTPSGRLFANQAGLVFWPRTARVDGAEVEFDMQIQGAVTRGKLIFVDNMAANRAELMDDLVAYYNRQPSPDIDQNQLKVVPLQPHLHLRTLDLRGQALRYCDEVKPGSASHKTLAWTLKATGCAGVTSYLNTRNKPIDPLEWEGRVERYDDPMLEGADQPPFFPAIETARIRIDQVERLTNGAPQAAIAQFDGWYLKNGFEADRISNDRDFLEIYLDIVNRVTMDMGSSGDRSGGVMRPAGEVIALSRQRGPLTGTTDAAVRSPGTTGSVTGANGYPVTPPKTPSPLRFVGGAVNATSGSEGRTKDAFRQFFENKNPELKSKILGLVSIADLVSHLNVSDAASDLPRLRDAVEYGLSGIESGAAVVRTQVVVPLNDVVKGLDEQWRKAGAQAKGSLPSIVGGMEDVFPDVDRALNDLLTVLGKSLESSDDPAFFSSLGDIYECGRRLMDACGRVAANPLDQLQIAAQKKLQGLGAGVEDLIKGLDRLDVEALVKPLNSSLTSAETALRVSGGAFDLSASMVAVMEKLRAAVEEQQPILAKFDESLSLLKVPPPVDLQIAIMSHRTPKGTSAPLNTARDFVDKYLEAIESWLMRAQGPLNSLPTTKNEVVAGACATALQYFKASMARIAEARNALNKALEVSEYRQAARALSTILEIADTLEKIKREPTALLPLFSQALSEYLALLVGPRLEKLPPLSDVKGLARKVLDPVKDIAESGMLKIADPQKPGNPNPAPPVGDKFSISSTPIWQVPGSNSSLVAHIHKVAEAVEAVLQKARQSDKKEDVVDDASRVKLAMLGHHALKAENQLHRATIALRLTGIGNAIADFDESGFQASVRQADAAYQALERLGESMDAAMQQLVQDLGAIPSTKGLDPIVTRVRTVVRETLGWLMDRNQSLESRLEEVANTHERWAELLVPWMNLSKTYQEKTKVAFDLADRKNSDWLEQKQLWLPSLPDPVSASKVTGAAAVTVLQRLVSEQVMAWVSSLAAPSQVATKRLLDAFRPIVQQVADAYKTFLDTRKTAYRATLGTPAEWVNDALLVAADPSLAFLPGQAPDKSETKAKDESDQLYLDSESLRNLRDVKGEMSAAERSQAVRFLDHIVTGWCTGQSTPLRIAKQVQRISLEEIRSKLMALINFSAIREEIEERIKLLIPTSTTLSYEFSTTIQSEAGSGKVFQPKEGCLLSVNSHARINLLDAKKGPTFQSIGELGAFDIRLLGSVDALTLHFKGVRFMSRGGTPDCDLQYDGFTIGNELRFLEQLTPFFGSKAGSGFYLQPLSSGVGLEAGYGLNLGTFSVGNLAIFNVSLNAAARLPFDNREATFVAALSRRDSPFTIAVAPYGGSGFFALEANTTGIVGFEASFEYGGAAAFKYGPLEGQGRLMVGAYIRSGKGEPKIFATFYVGGSASIWIFSFGASLYVNATQDKHSRNMVGSATYAFSFSMGFVDFDYRVNVDVDLPLDGSKKEEKKDERSAHSRGLDFDEPVRLAAINPEAWGSTVRDVPLHLASFQQSQQTSTRPKGTSSNGKPKRRVKTVCPSADWREYSRYFDMSLKVRLEEY